MKRSSTYGLECRELSVGERQWKGSLELASERLPEIFKENLKKVDADGIPAVIRAGYRCIRERMK